MTIGDCDIVICEVFVALAIVWFFYHGHNIVRFVAKQIRVVAGATVGAFHEWVFVFDEIFSGEDVDNGCKDM